MVWPEGVRSTPGTARGDADTHLVREARAGVSEAYNKLVRRYQDRIYNVVLGMVADEQDALDLVQEVFIKAYLGLGRFRQEAGFYTWLYRIAVHLCIDHSRRRKTRLKPLPLDQYLLDHPGLEPEDTSPTRDPERAVMSLHLRAAIHSALQELSEPFRTAVILRDIEGLDQEEVARIMRCPLGTAKTRIHRGRCQLRDRLRPLVQPDA